MALRQIGARTEGDVYQGLFFWHEAAGLLIPGSLVQLVNLEHDEATGVDDVAVFYEDPGVDAGGWLCTADFYQIKYHVDRREAYSSLNFIDPHFLSANAKSSLLEHFYTAYTKVLSSNPSCRLNFASNWRWREDDELAGILREYDGRLPDKFFSSSSNSKIGSIREAWRSHLSLDKAEFEAFAMTLRFQLDLFGRRDFREWTYDRLARAGLHIPEASKAASPYESLVQQFLMSGLNSFDRKMFEELCRREGLFANDKEISRIPTLAVRSFIRFAEGIEEEANEFVCIAREFEGRHPRGATSWGNAANGIVTFFGDPERRKRLRAAEHAILLECHGSLAILAGYEASINSGCQVFPIQKPRRELWKYNPSAVSEQTWAQNTQVRMQEVQDIAIALCVTHDISKDVSSYLDTEDAPKVSLLLSLKPITGSRQNSVRGADHAHKLAVDLLAVIRGIRPNPAARVHLFSSAPNSFLFFLGQFREAIGRIVMYEYDFGFERHCTYEESITLPLNQKTLEV
jgi:hypothetical protein